MALPIEDHALEQVRPAQEGAVGCGRSSQHDVITAAGADVAAVEHELVGAEPAQPRFLVERMGDLAGLAPSGGGMDIYLDDARIRRDLDDVQAGIGGGGRAPPPGWGGGARGGGGCSARG